MDRPLTAPLFDGILTHPVFLKYIKQVKHNWNDKNSQIQNPGVRHFVIIINMHFLITEAMHF